MAITISAIIPAYNCEATLGRALDSILAQTCPPDEIIIVNDGSTDNTAEVIASYAKKHSNIQSVTQENSGPAIARNHGVKLAKSDWVAFLDSDDYWLPCHLENLATVVESHPELSWAAAAYGTNKKGKNQTVGANTAQSIVPCYLANAHQSGKDPLHSNSVLIRRLAFEKCGGFRAGWYREEDAWLWFQLGLHYPQLGYSPIVSSFYEDCPTSITNQPITVQENLNFIVTAVDQMIQEANHQGFLEREDVKIYFGARFHQISRLSLMLSNCEYRKMRTKYRLFLPYVNLSLRVRIATWLFALGIPIPRLYSIAAKLGFLAPVKRSAAKDEALS